MVIAVAFALDTMPSTPPLAAAHDTSVPSDYSTVPFEPIAKAAGSPALSPYIILSASK